MRGPLFTMGTPSFEDIEDSTLIAVINDFLSSLGEDAPLLSLTLVAQAAPLLKGIEMPEIDQEDLKNTFIQQKEGPFATFFSNADDVAREAGLTEEMAAFLATVRTLQGKEPLDNINEAPFTPELGG